MVVRQWFARPLFVSCLLVLGAVAPQTFAQPQAEVTICYDLPVVGHGGLGIAAPGDPADPEIAIDDSPSLCCRADGSSCADDSSCCSGLCDAGTCGSPCAAEGASCASGDDCCSGSCAFGSCVPACGDEGDSCLSGNDCCSGNCAGGACIPACGENGEACETGADCCSGICTGTNQTCAESCVPVDVTEPRCDRDLDCCEGSVCIFGLCYPDEQATCSMPSGACNNDDGPFCCYDDECVDGFCEQRP